MNQEDFAVVIGLSRYDFLPPLLSRDIDARAFASWLTSPGGGGLPPENLSLLVSDDSETTVSRRSIDQLFLRLRDSALARDRAGRRLYIYVSGRGGWTSDRELALLLPEASLELSEAVNLSACVRYFQGAGLFEEVVTFMDLSQDVPWRLVPTALAWPIGPERDRQAATFFGVGMTLGASAEWSEGTFTRVLLNGLNGDALDSEGHVTSASLMPFVSSRLQQLAEEQSLQFHPPEFSSSGKTIIFAPAPVRRPVPSSGAIGGGAVNSAAVNGSSTSREPKNVPSSANPTPRIASDRWAEHDSLGYEALARTIAVLITHGETVAPLTIGIKAAWGAGKTSLMKRVQYLLDGDASVTEENESARRNRSLQVSLTLRQLLAGLQELTQIEPAAGTPFIGPPPRPAKTAGERREAQRTERKAEIETTLAQVSETVSKADRLGRIKRSLASIWGYIRRRAPAVAKRAATFVPPEPRSSSAGGNAGVSPRITVWFNAWKYQTGEQIWAGLAHCIISQLTARMSATDRELFWLKLHAARVDVNKLRWQLRLGILRELVPWFAFCLVFLIGGLAMLAMKITGAGLISVGLSVLLGWARYAREYTSKLADKVSGNLRDLVREPDYEGKLGFLHLVETDIREILDLVATPTRPVVIFIDDLDRCSPNKVAEIVEAINLFLCGDYPNCIFVLGMEPAMVAAALEVANKDVLAKVDSFAHAGDHVPLGWRFMEKIVQLPLAIPVPGTSGFQKYLAHLTGATRPAGNATPTPPEPRSDVKVAEYLQRLSEAQNVDHVVSLTQELLSKAPAADRAGIVEASKRAYAREFRDRDPVVSRFLDETAVLLQHNPRQLKRYINLFRFTSTLRYNLRMDLVAARSTQMSFASDAVMAKFIALNIQWPQAIDYLRQIESVMHAGAAGSRSLLTELETLARSIGEKAAPEADAEWIAKLKEMKVHRKAWIRSRAFREFLASGESVGGLQDCGLW